MKKTITESNRIAWNEALKYHQKARKDSLKEGFKNPEFTTFNRDCDEVLINILKNIDFKGKTIAQIPCDEKFNNYFDFIYISEGSLQWFKDLNETPESVQNSGEGFNEVGKVYKDSTTGKLIMVEG